MRKVIQLFVYLYFHQSTGFAKVNGFLTQKQVQISEDGQLNFTGLSKKYIRLAEEYDVTTEDGYILKLFRIPGNTSSVVLLSHGIFLSSDDYLIRGNTSLIYMIAENGFDVWAMNFRGNRYSRRHVVLNPDTDPLYWQFSMHEFGIYDYKSIIDFILKKTGEKHLSVVGHSEGTSAFFILASERPEYNEKVKVFAGLAPVTYLKHASPEWVVVSKIIHLLPKTLNSFNFEVAGYNASSTKAFRTLCLLGRAGYELCSNILRPFTGFNPENIEQEFTSTILGHTPTGTSWRNLMHYAHGYFQGRFTQYDYGLKNFDVYGSSKPPAYDLKKVVTKVALYGAKDDKIVGIKDMARLRKELPNVVHYQVVDGDKFNHIDFVWGRNACVKLYPFVISILQKYN